MANKKKFENGKVRDADPSGADDEETEAEAGGR